jgi:hypothetical protein
MRMKESIKALPSPETLDRFIARVEQNAHD